MSKQNKSGRGAQGATPDNKDLINAVIGEISLPRSERGDAQIDTSPYFRNVNNFERIPLTSLKRGNIIFNGNASEPVYNIVVKDGIVEKQLGSGKERGTYSPVALVLELDGFELRHPRRERKNVTDLKKAPPEFMRSWYKSVQYNRSETLLVLKDTPVIRQLIIQSLDVALRTKLAEKIRVRGADGVAFDLEYYKYAYDRELADLIIPVGYDTLETYEARLRPIVDPSLGRVEFGDLPKPEKSKAEPKAEPKAEDQAEPKKERKSKKAAAQVLDESKKSALTPEALPV